MKKSTLATTTSIIASLLLASCAANGVGDVQQASAQAFDAALFTNATRSDADKARDAGRKPAEVLNFLGLKQGDTVLDMIASGGWYTEILSVAVGPEGKVYAQNPEAALARRDRASDKALTARLAGKRLANVVRLDEEIQALTVADNSLDLALTALNIHDVHNSYGAAVTQGLLAIIKSKLKPGGTLAIIDHVGNADGDNKSLHRVDPAVIIKTAEAAGFVLEGQGDILANPNDDHTANVFGPDLRGKTDRFVLKLTKPE